MTSIPSILHGNLLPYLSQLHKTLDHSQVNEVIKKTLKFARDVKRKRIYKIMEKCTKLCMEE